MAMGRPTKWARMDIDQRIWLNRTGISIVVWDKYGRKRKGTLVVSVGGLRWYPYKGQRAQRYTWNDLAGD